MSQETLSIFINRLKELLAQITPENITKYNSYIDLSNDSSLNNFTNELNNEVYFDDPMVEVFEEILSKINKGQIDRVKIGINEILKSLIININKENEEYLVTYYLYRIILIFKRCLLKDFPYYDDLWEYLNNCINTVGIYLIEKELNVAAKKLLEATSKMGKIAAQKGMATSSTQWCLRNLENKALSMKHIELANYAKNFRFNLETY